MLPIRWSERINTVLGITLGDPGGIGPEVILKALKKISQQLTIILFGSESLFQPFQAITQHRITTVNCCQLPEIIHNNDHLINGNASYTYLEHAVSYAKSGKIQALITGPISKTAWQMAGITHTGHTTALQSLSQSNHVSMAFYTPTLKTILTTIHVPLMEVTSLLTSNQLQKTINHGQLFCQQLGITSPKIAVAGLNPHAGEGGLFGDEESLITDVIEQYDDTVSGPYPPDTLYYHANQGDFDLVVSLYHDQGLIPIKLIGFHDAVNVTIGLPFIRTSPDHGTAFNIARKGIANESSTKAAILLAKQLTTQAHLNVT